MAVTINGDTGVTTPGISNSEGYTGDGLTIAAGAPSGAMTLDASGNLAIGTTSIPTFTNYTTLGINNSSGAILNLAAGGTSYGRFQASSSEVGLYQLTANPLIFYTNNTERARIDSSGNLLVGTTSYVGGVGNARLTAKTSTTGVFAAGFEGYYGVGINASSATGNLMYFYYNSGGTPVGSISTNGTTVSYVTSSDYRLKNTIAPMTGALAKVAALKPVTYKWNVDGSDGEGFIAHELQEVCPSAVTGEKDAVEVVDVKDEDGNVIGTEERPVYQGIDTSFLVATLTAAIQEQQALIESLTARVVALEGAQIV